MQRLGRHGGGRYGGGRGAAPPHTHPNFFFLPPQPLEIYPHGGVLEAHRPRALKYTPTGGSPRPVPEANRPRPIGQGPWSPWGPIWACIFGSCIFGAKSTLLGSQSVDSLAPWGVQAESLFNKDCLQSFLGSLGPPRTRLYPYTFL